MIVSYSWFCVGKESYRVPGKSTTQSYSGRADEGNAGSFMIDHGFFEVLVNLRMFVVC